MALFVRVKPRAEQQIDSAAAWWSENRPAAPGAIREDLKTVLEVLVEQPGIGTSVENARNQDVRRLYLKRYSLDRDALSAYHDRETWEYANDPTS